MPAAQRGHNDHGIERDMQAIIIAIAGYVTITFSRESKFPGPSAPYKITSHERPEALLVGWYALP